MNGVHDMGGLHGFGAPAIEPDEPVFHAPWEARALAITLAAAGFGLWTLDASRHAREKIPPATYLRLSYYERWIAGLERLLVESGLASHTEIANLAADPAAPKRTPALDRNAAAAVLASGGPTLRPRVRAARFAPGQAVRARVMNPAGHTRLPRYVRGRAGCIERDHGDHVLPDANAHGLGERPEPLYLVRFDARELFGLDADPNQTVRLDLWESYLEPA